MDLREAQRPLKERYRHDPEASRITLAARGSTTDQPVTCSVDIGRMVYEAQAHEVDAPEADGQQLAALHEKAEPSCTVLRTLRTPPAITTERAA